MSRSLNINDQGYFIFEESQIKVLAPTDVYNMAIYKNKEGEEERASFITLHGYWQMSPSYRIIVFKNKYTSSKDEFYAFSAEIAALEREYYEKLYGLNLQVHQKGSKKLIHNHPAYQEVAHDSNAPMFHKGAIATTLINLGNHIIIVSALYPLQESSSHHELINWRSYNKFLNSIRYVEFKGI